MEAHDILFKGYRFKPKKVLKMDIVSFFGSAISPKIRQSKNKYIQIGCGNTIRENFENLDFFPMRFKEIFSCKHICHDLRKPLPYEDNVFEGAYSEHTLEHLYYEEAINLLMEIKRVLKPNCVFRCTVPDLEKYIKFYNNDLKDDFFDKFTYKAEAFFNLTQNYEHKSIWDYEILSKKMRDIGFKDIMQKSFKEGNNKDLLLDLDYRRPETLYVECKS